MNAARAGVVVAAVAGLVVGGASLALHLHNLDVVRIGFKNRRRLQRFLGC